MNENIPMTVMNESILMTIRPLLGFDINNDSFMDDTITDINAAIFILQQLGVGCDDTFYITGMNESWIDFLGTKHAKLYVPVKEYIVKKVKKTFDTPQSSALSSALDAQINELENRILYVTNMDPQE